jgi:transcription termination/antitermination protein NusG
MKKWLVAYVRLHHEKKTAERLTAMNIENFLPVQEEIRQWTYRKKKIKRVVIPMMIFVHVDAAERSQVLTLSAISRYMVLHGEHTPAVIPDEQMERFKFMLDYSDEAVEMCTEPLAPGELIRVVKGPLKGLEGELVEVDGKAKVVVRKENKGMRLQSKEIQTIIQIAKDIYGETVQVYLFGSRLNDEKRGGDIDLLVRSTGEKKGVLARIRMTARLKLHLGDQKIDVIGDHEDSPVVQEALKNGIQLI